MQRQHAISCEETGQTGHRHALATGARFLLRQIGRMFDVARERRQLAELDDRMLKDIGLSRSVAFREFDRSFVDLP